MAETRTINLRKGNYFAGFSRPFFVSDDMVRGHLEELGATQIAFHRRDNETPPVDPTTDPDHSDEWDEWISCRYEGPPTTVEENKLWAWAVVQPDLDDAPRSKLAIRPGRNIWVLGRTDRDAPDTASAIETAAALLARVLSPQEGNTFAPGVGVPGGPDGAVRYCFGPARPCDLNASQTRPMLPPSQEHWTFEADQPDALALNAEHPWYVLADFDWRGPTRVFEEWPQRAIDPFGIPIDLPHSLDWLLLEARTFGPATRPDRCSTWGDAFKERVVDPVVPPLVFGSSALLLLAALWLLRK